MKNILVLTDFSKNSKNAAAIGASLSSKLKTNLLLFNCYITNAPVPYVNEPWMLEEVIWGDDDNKDCLNKQAAQLRDVIAKFGAADYKPIVYCHNGEGKLGNMVQEIVRKENVELIIMGARAEKPDEDGLFGSDINSVIQHSSRPVLVIPPGCDPDKLKKVIFATDWDEKDKYAINYLLKLSAKLNFTLEIVHISNPDENGTVKEKKQTKREHLVDYLSRLEIRYSEITGRNVADLLIEMINEKNADMLAVMHHQRTVFTRMFYKSTTKRILDGHAIPLMVFPSKME